MSESIAQKFTSLLTAASFSARAHRHQLRKDGQTPYAAHPFRVCLIVRHVFGIDDPDVMTAALLHDTIEDTTTDRDDLIELFGAEVAGWVAALSKDARLPDDERETAYMKALAEAPAAVAICKLADIFDNMIDSRHLSEARRQSTIARSKKYLAYLQGCKSNANEPAFAAVNQLLAELEKA